MDYPKYQYSIFLQGRDEQLVIRAETWDEFIELKKNANAIIERKEKTSNAPKTAEQDNLGGTMCEIHKVEMKAREGQYGTFWSHAKKEGDKWVYCNGKTGYK